MGDERERKREMNEKEEKEIDTEIYTNMEKKKKQIWTEELSQQNTIEN